MINYLNWMAQYVIGWPEHYTYGYVITEDGIPQYVRFNNGQGFSKAEWRAERDEMTAARNQYIADVSRKAMAGYL